MWKMKLCVKRYTICVLHCNTNTYIQIQNIFINNNNYYFYYCCCYYYYNTFPGLETEMKN